MYHKTRGIVLHTIKYSETSVITKIYTEKFGLQSYIVKGVRAAKSKAKAAILQPMTLLEMEVSHRENKHLQFIKEFRRAYIFQSIPFDMLKSSTSLFLLEVVTKCIREHEPNGEMFDFIFESLCSLDAMTKPNPDFHLLFLLHFSAYLGFSPHDDFSEKSCHFEMKEGVFTSRNDSVYVLNKKESSVLSELMRSNLFGKRTLKISRTERQQTLKNLLQYYQLHLENFNLKSPEILEQVLD